MNGQEQAERSSSPATSISGEIEDVSVLDIMQFIHRGMRSGTLCLRDGEVQAVVRFNCGRIVNASAPGTPTLGARLIEDSLIDPERLRESLAAQQEGQTRHQLGSILLERRIVPKEELQEALTEQVEETIRELLQMCKGSFAFTLDDPLRDNGEPELRAQISLDTQAVLLECLRIIDERGSPARREKGGETADAFEPGAGFDELFDRQLRTLEQPYSSSADDVLELQLPVEDPPDTPPPSSTYPVRFQLLSDDESLLDGLNGAFTKPSAGHLVRVDLRDAGAALPGETPPILVADVRGGLTSDQVAALRRRRPRVALVAVSDSPLETAGLYAAGATVVERPDPRNLAACLESLAAQRGKTLLDVTESHLFSTSLTKLRRALVELRSGLLSSTVALNLLHFLADSVERAVLFLVRAESLEVLGAFGFNESSGKPLADLTRGMVLQRDEGNPLSSSIDNGRAYSVGFDQSRLPGVFSHAVGRPSSGQAVIVPIPGRAGIVSIVYTDNGHLKTLIEDIEIFDLVTTQLGMAFENELLLRRLARLEGRDR